MPADLHRRNQASARHRLLSTRPARRHEAAASQVRRRGQDVFCAFFWRDVFFDVEDFAGARPVFDAAFASEVFAEPPKMRSQPSENLVVDPVLTV